MLCKKIKSVLFSSYSPQLMMYWELIIWRSFARLGKH